GFPPRRAAQQQRDLAIRPGLLGQVVVDDQRVLAAVTEVLAHRATGVGRDVLHRSRLGRGRGHDDRIGHRAGFLQLAHDVGDGRGFRADRDVHAEQILALGIDDRVDRNRGLAGLAVADDQLALSATDRHHRVDRLQPRLHRLRYRFAKNDAGGDFLDHIARLGLDRTLAVDRLAQRVDHATEQLGADRYVQDAPGGLHGVALGYVLVVAQDHRADRIALEVQRQTEGVVLELEDLALHRVGQAVDAADTVGHGDHRALRAHIGIDTQLLDSALEQLADFGRVQLHVGLRAIDSCSQLHAHRVQPGAHRPIQHAIPHGHSHAADQLRLEAQLRFQAVRELAAEPFDQVAHLRLAQLECRFDQAVG